MNRRLDLDPISDWEINENRTRYDLPRQIPSSQDLHIQFSVLSVINAIVAVVCLIIVVAILRSAAVRSKPFNLYLLFIALPDFFNSFFCMITCSMSAPLKAYYSERMCGFQTFYLTFGYTANCWLNAVIAFQIHRMLRYSNVRRRYTPPSRRQVICHAIAVYAYAAMWGALGVWPIIPGLPHEKDAYYGFACFAMEYNLESTIFWYLVFVPFFLLIPCVYFAYVLFDIWKRQLFPPSGRRRNLALYFMRLICVYFFMWIPFLVVCCIGNFVNISSWYFWAGAAWSHLQGFFSCLLCLTKEDIREAVWSLLTCSPPPAASTSSSNLASASSSLGPSTMRLSFMARLRSFRVPMEMKMTSGAVAGQLGTASQRITEASFTDRAPKASSTDPALDSGDTVISSELSMPVQPQKGGIAPCMEGSTAFSVPIEDDSIEETSSQSSRKDSDVEEGDETLKDIV